MGWGSQPSDAAGQPVLVKPDKHAHHFPPQPYIVPGYGGQCPGFQYEIGHTNGALTSNLLTNSKLGQNRKMQLLQTVVLNKNTALLPVFLPSGRVYSKNYHHPTSPAEPGGYKGADLPISGYTGFIPKQRYTVALSYQSAVREALDNVQRNQNPSRVKETLLLPRGRRIYSQTGMLPHYTGFIPGVRNKYGMSYSKITRESFREYRPDQ
ncbi:ciliary microtubule inner protein 2B [Amia ocellicauda]|uniref:ciliary microtubule inner protein 2B n=1 Tax=Amia ocellicauda TaxID=2972642 RepID=UPI003464D297